MYCQWASNRCIWERMLGVTETGLDITGISRIRAVASSSDQPCHSVNFSESEPLVRTRITPSRNPSGAPNNHARLPTA